MINVAKSWRLETTRHQSYEPFTSLYLQVCKCKSSLKSLVISSVVKFNLLASISSLNLKVKTSISGLNSSELMATSDFKMFLQACKQFVGLTPGCCRFIHFSTHRKFTLSTDTTWTWSYRQILLEPRNDKSGLR